MIDMYADKDQRVCHIDPQTLKCRGAKRFHCQDGHEKLLTE
jgi:hypothetical protein